MSPLYINVGAAYPEAFFRIICLFLFGLCTKRLLINTKDFDQTLTGLRRFDLEVHRVLGLRHGDLFDVSEFNGVCGVEIGAVSH